MDFTKEHYLKLISYYHGLGYKYYGIESNKKNNLIIRHDVDYSLTIAVDFAHFEHLNGIKSTYYLLMTSNFYNLFSKESRGLVNKLLSYGHDIGIHFDYASYDVRNFEDLETLVHFEKNIFERYFNTKIKSISFHRPIESNFDLPKKISGLTNLYNEDLFYKINYFSDSRRNWKKDPFSIEDLNKPIQLLTHPVWFETNAESILKTLNNLEHIIVKEFWVNVSKNISNFKDIQNGKE